MNTKNATPATFTNAAVAKLYHWAGIVREAVVVDNVADPLRCIVARNLHEAVIAAKPEIAALTAKAAALDALVAGLAVAEAGIAAHIARSQADGVSANFGVLGAHRQLLLNAAKAAQAQS